jgi:hypothetical protein
MNYSEVMHINFSMQHSVLLQTLFSFYNTMCIFCSQTADVHLAIMGFSKVQ